MSTIGFNPLDLGFDLREHPEQFVNILGTHIPVAALMDLASETKAFQTANSRENTRHPTTPQLLTPKITIQPDPGNPRITDLWVWNNKEPHKVLAHIDLTHLLPKDS